MTARDATAPGPTAWTEDAAFVAEVEASLCLRHTPGLGPRTWKRILDRYPTATDALAEARHFVVQGLCSANVATALIQGFPQGLARREMDAAAAKGLTPLPFSSPFFPARLRELPDPPILLYGIGELSLLCRPSVALVGARHCSRYGFENAWHIAAGLSAAGVTVVSGLAFGIDRQAHLGALTGPGSSVAVLGTGLDLVYPDANLDVWKELAAHGAIISEFAPGTPPQAQNFPIRNRVIAGLSLGVMVVEAAARSGSLITARLALDQGREVFALPGPVTLPTFAGCHTLLAAGATLVQSADDILAGLSRELGESLVAARAPSDLPLPPPPAPARQPAPTPPPPVATVPLEGLEAALFALLADGERRHIDALARELQSASGAISRALVSLELKGLVRKWPGMYYSGEREEHGRPCRKSH